MGEPGGEGGQEEGPVHRGSQTSWSLSQKKACLLRSYEVRHSLPQTPDTGPGLPFSATGLGRESDVRSEKPELSHPYKSPRSTLSRPLEGHPGPDLSEFY